MSPAQLQLALALVERMANQLHTEYLDSSARHLAMFEELSQVNRLRDDLRTEVESLAAAAEVSS